MKDEHRQIAKLLLLAPLVLMAFGASRATPSLSEGSRRYVPCGACHAPKAWGSIDGTIPILAGQQRGYLEKQMELFRSGARVDPAMQVVATHSAVGDHDDIVALASYLSNLESNPHPVNGSGENLRVGQEIYAHICAACHGTDGRGNSGNRVPRIAGQHYPYLRRQIDAAAAFHRALAPPEMTSALRGMRSPEKDALADFISRLANSDALLDSNRPGAEIR